MRKEERVERSWFYNCQSTREVPLVIWSSHEGENLHGHVGLLLVGIRRESDTFGL